MSHISNFWNRLYLHLKTRHSNVVNPGSQYIDIDKYPRQSKFVDSVVRLKYRNNNVVDKNTYEGTEALQPHDVYSGLFRILRYDIDPPYKFIAISEDYKILLVYNFGRNITKINDTEILDLDIVFRYPVQISKFIGLKVSDKYSASYSVAGRILRIDNSEPCYTVIAEEIGTKIRFILGDECEVEVDEDTFNDCNFRSNRVWEYDIVSIRKEIIGDKTIWK